MEVFYSNPWVPREWIMAHGHEPRGLWGAPGHPPATVAAGVCAFAQSALDGLAIQPGAATVFATCCDQMRRTFDAAGASGSGSIFLFNIPATWQTSSARRLYRAEMDRLGRFLEDLGGQAPTGQRLAEIMRENDRAREQLRQAAGAYPARQWLAAVERFFWDGRVHFEEQPWPEPCPGIPLALLGGPMVSAQAELLDAVEQAGGRVVLNAVEPGERCLLPAFPEAGLNEDPASLLASHYFEQIVDVFQRPNTRLYDWLRQRLADRGVRGILLWHYVGCDLWRAEAQSLREAFGLPLLPIEPDETQRLTPRQVNRLQAFLETLQ